VYTSDERRHPLRKRPIKRRSHHFHSTLGAFRFQLNIIGQNMCLDHFVRFKQVMLDLRRTTWTPMNNGA
jgi:hypothetical protein